MSRSAKGVFHQYLASFAFLAGEGFGPIAVNRSTIGSACTAADAPCRRLAPSLLPAAPFGAAHRFTPIFVWRTPFARPRLINCQTAPVEFLAVEGANRRFGLGAR